MKSNNDALAIKRYKKLAKGYDQHTIRIEKIRQLTIALLNLTPGDTVVDMACGTGVSFATLREQVGETGTVIGVELSPEMMAQARDTVEKNGWKNVVLIEASAEAADLPAGIDAVLLNYAQDVMQSADSLSAILKSTKPGTRIAASGLKLYSWWFAPLNIYLLWRSWQYMTTFNGLRAPWRLLQGHLPDLNIEFTLHGRGYIAHGTV